MTELANLRNLLNLGVVIEADAPYLNWHERLLRALGSLEGVKLVCINLDQVQMPGTFSSFLSRAAYNLDTFVSRARAPDTRLAWKQMTLGAPASDGHQILDVMIDLRTNPANPGAAGAREVWSLNAFRGPGSAESFCMRAASAGTGAFEVSLDRVAGGGFDRLDSAVCATRFSAARNMAQIGQVSVAMILRTLRARVSGLAEQQPRSGCEAAERQLKITGRPFGQHEPLGFAVNFVANATVSGLDGLARQFDYWRGSLEPNFQVYRASGSPLDFSLRHARSLGVSQDHYLADPFLHRHQGRLWLFCEVYDYDRNTGTLAVAELTQFGLGPFEPVVGGDGHMSYPHVFEHDGEVYMLPETCARRRIEVWRAIRFPYEWELVSTALDGEAAVDTNLHHDGDKWWLATNCAFDADSEAGLELHVFEVDGPLLGKLQPHARNPVVADARYSRNGGRFFSRSGRLYRPAQSIEFGRYGYGLYIMEVLKLTALEYAERPVRFIRGCHHLDSSADDIVFDLRRGTPLEADHDH
jgi:hypothetical protein